MGRFKEDPDPISIALSQAKKASEGHGRRKPVLVIPPISEETPTDQKVLELDNLLRSNDVTAKPESFPKPNTHR